MSTTTEESLVNRLRQKADMLRHVGLTEAPALYDEAAAEIDALRQKVHVQANVLSVLSLSLALIRGELKDRGIPDPTTEEQPPCT